MKGIRRKGRAATQKAPGVTDDIRAMVDATDGGLIGARDRALVPLGFAGAFRRSELVGLDIEDCIFGKDGLTFTLRHSKRKGRAGRSESRMARILRPVRFAQFRRGWKSLASTTPDRCSVQLVGTVACSLDGCRASTLPAW